MAIHSRFETDQNFVTWNPAIAVTKLFSSKQIIYMYLYILIIF